MTSAYEILAQLKRTASGPMTEARGAEPAFYWNEEVASAEENAIFRHDWVCPGLASEIPDVGDYLTFSIAGEPVFSIRCFVRIGISTALPALRIFFRLIFC